MDKQKDIKPWETVSSKYLIQRPWLTARRDVLRMPDGKLVPEYYVLEYPTWVNIIAITTEGKYLLVRQYRHALGIVEHEPCAGTMDAKDATPLDAAKRELLEETGYAGGEWTELTALSANPTSMNNLNHTFIAKGVEKVSSQHLDETEEITVHLFTLQELIDLLRRDELKQSLMGATSPKTIFCKVFVKFKVYKKLTPLPAKK